MSQVLSKNVNVSSFSEGGRCLVPSETILRIGSVFVFGKVILHIFNSKAEKFPMRVISFAYPSSKKEDKYFVL